MPRNEGDWKGDNAYNPARKGLIRVLLAILLLLVLPVSLFVLWRFIRLNPGLKAAITVVIALAWFIFVFFSP